MRHAAAITRAAALQLKCIQSIISHENTGVMMHVAAAVLPGTYEQGKVLGKALIRAAERLGLSAARLATAIGVSEASVSRLTRGTRTIEPGTKEAELAALVIRCFRSLDTLVGGDDAQRRAWMASHNRALNGVPRDLIMSAQGLVMTVAYLDQMRSPL